MGLLAAAALAVGVVGWAQYVRQNASSSASNASIVDEKATARVQSAVAQGLEQVLSYTYSDPTTTQAAADRVLTGKAREEYDTLFATLKKEAPGQKLVLTARVTAAGVKQLSDDTASLLVFVDQSARRKGDEQAAVSAAQIAVEARRTGSTWTITGLDPL
ncbi:hypothetical protein ASD11_16825 [Aeromicrobium sp. Root495]|nr:hypothetical protein ASD11_16825 [Aeromicrobium sp. Root495]